MSLSTLGAQLAAIHKVPTSSRRHEDAIGRGIAHSVQVGHSLTAGSNSSKYKPSIIYQDSKAASDVPLTTIRDNAIQALRQLESFDSELGTFVEAVCAKSDRERGLLTSAENEILDEKIHELTSRLSLQIYHKARVPPCLHVLEFLIRRYDLHLRPSTANFTLRVLLPHHEQPFFLRWLQLMDLASSQWSFLRPFTVPGAHVGRAVIAQQASKDIGLVRELLQLSQRHAKIRSLASEGGKTLSFTAAVFVESWALQYKSKGSMEERTCQAALPIVVAACRQSKCVEYQNWGHVLVSAMVELCLLAEEPRTVLITSVLQGMANNSDNEVNNNGLLVCLELLAQPCDTIDPKVCQLYLGEQQYYGYAMDKTIFSAFLRLPNLPTRLGYLFSTEGILDVQHVIASLLVVGWNRYVSSSSKKSSSKSSKVAQLQNLIQGIIQEQSLKETLFKSAGPWVESISSFLLVSITRKLGIEDDGNENVLSFCRSLLKDLNRMDRIAHERGITDALLRAQKEDRKKLAEWLGLKKKSDDGNADSTMAIAENSIVLPPRVALEHTVAEMRLDAIARLLDEEQNKNEDAMDIDGTEDEGETLRQALLRRVVIDDDDKVALAAATGLCRLLSEDQTNAITLAQDALQGLYKWTEAPNLDTNQRSLIIVQVLRILAYAAKGAEAEARNSVYGEGNAILVQLVEALGAHLTDSNDYVSKEAAKSIIFVFSNKSRNAKGFKTARALLVSTDNDALRLAFRRNLGKARRIEKALRRRVMSTLLIAFTESLATKQRSRKLNPMQVKMAHEALEYCIWAIGLYSEDITEEEQKLLSDCLWTTTNYTAASTERICSTFTLLAASSSASTFSTVLAPYFKAVVENVRGKDNEEVAGISVLLEVALSSNSNVVIERLLSVAIDQYVSGDNAEICYYGFVPAFALIANEDERVRTKAIDLISSIGEALKKHASKEWKFVAKVCQYVDENRSAASMGGDSFLSRCLSAVALDCGKGFHFQKSVLSLCVYSAAACSSNKSALPSKTFEKRWLDLNTAGGGQKAAVTILRAAQKAGEDAFPLLLRWEVAGKPILDGLLATNISKGHEVSTQLHALVNAILQMLKGVKIIDPNAHADSASNTIIMSGPTRRGGRTRSYSFGKSDGVTFLKPYPKEMRSAITNILKSNRLGDGAKLSLLRTVLSSQSWGKGVFANLSSATRQEIASIVLHMTKGDLADSAEESFFSLPLDARDVSELLDAEKDADDRMVTIAYLADFASTNAKKLSQDSSISNLFSAFFEHLSILSDGADEDEGLEFAVQSILTALLELLGAIQDGSPPAAKLDKEKSFNKWAELIITIIGGEGKNSPTRILQSIRSKRTALTLLTKLCSSYPSSIAEKLITAMNAMISNTRSKREACSSAESLNLIVPTYFKCSQEAGLTPAYLLNEFVSATSMADSEIRVQLYQGFVDAIAEDTKVSDELLFPVGSVLAACLSGEVHAELQESESGKASVLPQLAIRMLHNASTPVKIVAVRTLLGYAKEIVAILVGEKSSLSESSLLSAKELISIAQSGPGVVVEKALNHKRRVSGVDGPVVKLCTALLEAVHDTVSSPFFVKFVKQIAGESSTLILRLWQDLLLVESACNSFLATSAGSKMTSFWETAGEITNDTLVAFHSYLPSHIFLAFTSTLLKEGGTEELRARAVQLIAERCSAIDPSDPEAALFRDMLPLLTKMVKVETGSTEVNDTSCGKVLCQSALVAIESIARSLCFPSRGISVSKGHVHQLSTAIMKASTVMEDESKVIGNSTFGFSELQSSSRQLVCSAGLCAATVVRVCGPNVLPALPKLVKSLVLFLSATNSFVSSSDEKGPDLNQAKMMQLSMIRLLASVVETIPQFLSPYLGSLFSPMAFPSKCLRTDSDEQSLTVKISSQRLEELIASRVPARQLIPALSDVLVKSKDSNGSSTILSILMACVKGSKGSQLSGQVGALFKTVTFVYDNFNEEDESNSLHDASNKLILALVLKLSEVQLRKLYGRLREWRGAVDEAYPKRMVARRAAFWSLSASLSKELQSIYLPCLSTVFSDAVEELVSPFISIVVYHALRLLFSHRCTGVCSVCTRKARWCENSRRKEEAKTWQSRSVES